MAEATLTDDHGRPGRADRLAARAPARSLDAFGVMVMILCCSLWGGNAVAVKFAVPALPPFGCAGFRFLISLPILAMVCRLVGQPILVRRELWGLLAIHGLLTALQIGTFNWGTSHSAAGRSSIFINVHPLIVAPWRGSSWARGWGRDRSSASGARRRGWPWCSPRRSGPGADFWAGTSSS